jgi:miniconductance mechanosensitive channel
MKVCDIYITIVIVRLICAFITSLYTISSEHEKLKERSMKGFYQMLKLVVICIGTIVIIATILNQSPAKILAGLGAGTAILMLVFQDTIKGLVAGIQLTVNDMVRPGDWIAMPKYGADGDVMEVSLTTVKVRNWDKTITTVPPYALVNDSFQNWRGMQESGGRRVKRSVYIDMRSIKFCTPEQMADFEQKGWLEGIVREDNFPVNLHIFRNYLDKYLRSHSQVNQDMIIMVRQLQPTAQGLPLELYFFSDGTAWISYEKLQAEVFEHVFAMLPIFGLRVFQSPMGSDFSGNTSSIN